MDGWGSNIMINVNDGKTSVTRIPSKEDKAKADRILGRME